MADTSSAPPAAPGDDETPAVPDTYRLKFPVEFGEGNTIEELKLQPTGRAMAGFKVETTKDGGVLLDPYRFAELGLKLANQPRAVIDKMHPCDQFGLGMVVLGFFTSGPRTGRTASR